MGNRRNPLETTEKSEKFMSTTVIGLYDDAGKADRAIKALVDAGARREDITLFGSGQGAQSADQLVGRLTQHGFDRGEADRFRTVVQQGKVVVAAEIVDEDADAAARILDENGARDLDEITQQSGQQQSGQQSGQRNETRRTENEETIPVVQEEVHVGKRRVAKGGARIITQVTQQPVRETVRLREEEVDIQRRPVNRTLEQREAEAAFQEKTRELTETAEEAKVTKEARVVEEVAVAKKVREHEETIEDTARRTDVKVERTEGADRDTNKR